MFSYFFLGKTKIINQEINHSSLHLVGKNTIIRRYSGKEKKWFLWALPKTYQNINQNIAYHRNYKECELYPARARSARARRACVLRALGLLLADGTPTLGGGKTF